jgi:hypothetical protein
MRLRADAPCLKFGQIPRYLLNVGLPSKAQSEQFRPAIVSGVGDDDVETSTTSLFQVL